MAEVGVIIAIDPGAAGRFDEIVDICARAGLRVARLMPELGVVAGQIEESCVDDLRRVTGVASVEHDRTITLPPEPEAP
jgi:hypothetical protein